MAAVLLLAACAAPASSGSTLEGIREVRAQDARSPARPAADPVVQSVVEADAAFALKLYQILAGDTTGNLFYSPYSISTALSLAYAGARGETARQLEGALAIAVDSAAWHDGRNSVELALAAERKVPSTFVPLKLEPTNAIFGQDGFPFEADYLRILAADYGAGLQAVDFSQSEAARKLVNSWVNERTHDRIPELLPVGSVDASTVAVLVNAIYFKGNWLNQFDAKNTTDQPFHRLDGSDVTAHQMHGQLETSYVDGDGWQAVRLPYAGDASMLLIVPGAGEFAAVEGQFSTQMLAEVEAGARSADVNIDMPKWESASSIDLKPPLQAAGITDLFESGKADLTGMAANGGLFVAAAVHQANITVDEQGTEAAAATALAVAGSAPAQIVTLSVDRPFLYLIRDDVTGEILFSGRVLDPTAG
jgi:serpin B